MNGFAKRMKQYMNERDWTLQQFADLLGVTRQDVHGWVMGVHTPYIHRLEGMAQKMNVSVDWLLGKNDSNISMNDLSARKKSLIKKVEDLDEKIVEKLEQILIMLEDK